MRLRPLFRKAADIYREEGARTLLSEGRSFVKDNRKGSYQLDRRVDTEDRFSRMRPRLSEEDVSLLDIGCAEGELTTMFSDLGMFSVGVDSSVSRISTARKGETLDGPGFIFHELDPNAIRKVPEFDVILLLTVIHHWYDAYGWEDAEEMLRMTARKSGKLFFEPPGRPLARPETDGLDDEAPVRDYYESYLDLVFDGDVEVEFLGKTPYMGGTREDPLFFIDCSGYTS